MEGDFRPGILALAKLALDDRREKKDAVYGPREVEDKEWPGGFFQRFPCASTGNERSKHQDSRSTGAAGGCRKVWGLGMA